MYRDIALDVRSEPLRPCCPHCRPELTVVCNLPHEVACTRIEERAQLWTVDFISVFQLVPARIDARARDHKVHGSVLVDCFLCLKAQCVIMRAYSELICLPGILGRTVYRIACRAAEDGGQTTVNIIGNGKAA